MSTADEVSTPEVAVPTPTAAAESGRVPGDSEGRVARWLRRGAVCLGLGGVAAALGTIGYISHKYRVAETMVVAVEERDTFAYPEDPSPRSTRYGQYQGRRLKLVQRDVTHFDFVFEPVDAAATPGIATVTFHNVDVARMTPGAPKWTRRDAGLTRIALTDREWNRQQVQFDPRGEHVSIVGGDGWEAEQCTVASLAKNCLNAGLWEVLLFHHEAVAPGQPAKKTMFYQGWFTFPMGHYSRLVEHNTGFDYRDHWYKLEHWDDPAGTVVNLDGLRTVEATRETAFAFDPGESLVVGGEQVRKRRTLLADNVQTWGDFPRRVAADPAAVQFATFIPPGTYDVETPWGNEYWRLAEFVGGEHRRVSTATGREADELELTFRGSDGSTNRFLVGGVDLAALPQLEPLAYPKGLYMPMGIGVPPFYQDYADLLAADPMESDYYSVLLDESDRWIDHHTVAIDGPVMHRDAQHPRRVHLYLLSYERHTLVGHFTIDLPAGADDETTTIDVATQPVGDRGSR